MALSTFDYTKSWRNPADFPSFEENEEKVREDMQLLFDECRDAINRLAREVRAETIPFSATPEIDSATVQNAIEIVQTQIRNTAMGQVPNGSVGPEKLAELAITTSKLAELAVTSAKLADLAVTAAKLAAGAVETDKLADGAVTGEKLADGAVTAAKMDPAVLAGKADLDGGKVRAEQLSRARVNVSASRNLALSDAGKALFIAGGQDVQLGIPSNSTTPFPVGTEIEVFRAGTGSVSFVQDGSITVYTAGSGMSLLSRNAGVRLKKWDTNTWSLEGAALLPEGYLANYSTGFAPSGAISLRRGVHYFSSVNELPSAGQAGRVYLVELEG